MSTDVMDASPRTTTIAERRLRLRVGRRPPTNPELEDLYAFDPVAARIVDRLADDATRQPFTLKGEDIDAKAVASRVEDLEVLRVEAEAIRSARLYGGCLVVADDGGAPDKPFKGPIVALRIVDAPDARPDLKEPTLAEYLHPETYSVSLGTGMTTIHASRVFRVDAVRVPVRMLAMRNTSTNPGWGLSVLQRLLPYLQRLQAAYDHASRLLHILSVPGLQITNLKQQLLSDGGRAEVADLLDSIARSMDTNGLLAIDKNDSPFVINREARGAVDLLGEQMKALVAATDMPAEILTGQTPGGLNTGALAGPVRLWYDSVDAYRQAELTPLTVWILDRSGLPLPEEYTVEWAPLWQPDASEVAALYKMTAEADAIYAVTIGAITAMEIRQARFVDGVKGPITLPPFVMLSPAAAAAPAAPGAAPPPEEEPEPTAPPSTAPQPGDAVSTREAAAAYGVPTRTISLALERGELSYWGLGRHKRVSLAEVATLAKRHEEQIE